MIRPLLVPTEQRYFDDVEVGTTIPERAYGPHDLVTAVFWASVQENAGPLHFDREYVRAHRGAKSVVASGQLRQSLLGRTLLDWAGPRGFLRAMNCRHTAQTYEGDLQRYSATVVEKSPDAADSWIICAFDGRNQEGEQLLRGRATLLLPLRAWPLDRPICGAGT
jgi:acyl dehydratase